MFTSRHAVSDVFTPRRTDVNREIYVDRPDLEKELGRALMGSLHAVVFGESGSGKSWLYKKVLADLNAQSATVNCANALRFHSLTDEIRHVVTAEQPKRLSGQDDEMNASVKALVAEGGLKSTRKYEFGESDPLLECFSLIRQRAGKNLAVLIIDNLEMIFSSEPLMNELAAMITLLDDVRYAEWDVKLLIVGVPSGVKDYFSKTYTSVANRVSEISEVSSLSKIEVSALVEKGFVDLLNVHFEDGLLSFWQEHIFRVTMGFAQPVQEYCEQLGYIVEESKWKASAFHLQSADAAWLKQGLSQASGMIALLMNERDTKVGRRNQVLFVLGRIEKRVFHVAEVEALVRHWFPETTTGTTLAVGQILSEMTSSDYTIIRRSAKGPSYEFRDARFAMALRVLLEKDDLKDRVFKLSDRTQAPFRFLGNEQD